MTHIGIKVVGKLNEWTQFLTSTSPYIWEFKGLKSENGENFSARDFAKYYDSCARVLRNKLFLQPQEFKNILLIHTSNDFDTFEISCPCDGDGNNMECNGMAEEHIYDNFCQFFASTYPAIPIQDIDVPAIV